MEQWPAKQSSTQIPRSGNRQTRKTLLKVLYNPKHPPEMPGPDLQNAQSSQLKLQGWRILDTFENEDIAFKCLTYMH